MLIIILVYLIPLLILIYFEYVKIYGKARTISSASESVVEGNFNAILSEEEEGDFAILGHNFNNMANRLKFSMESLKEDKVFLKNIISDISHQLKTPLSSLYAINDILLENPSMEPEIQKISLEKNRSQLNRMEWLNISNTISTNLLLRTKEFAVLKAVGMTEYSIKKMILLEGLLYGIIAAVYGSILGILCYCKLYNLLIGIREVPWSMPWKNIFIATFGSIFVALISSIIPMRKINEGIVVEDLRTDN